MSVPYSVLVLWVLIDASVYLILQFYLLVLFSSCPFSPVLGSVCSAVLLDQNLQFHNILVLEVDATEGEPENK